MPRVVRHHIEIGSTWTRRPNETFIVRDIIDEDGVTLVHFGRYGSDTTFERTLAEFFKEFTKKEK